MRNGRGLVNISLAPGNHPDEVESNESHSNNSSDKFIKFHQISSGRNGLCNARARQVHHPVHPSIHPSIIHHHHVHLHPHLQVRVGVVRWNLLPYRPFDVHPQIPSHCIFSRSVKPTQSKLRVAIKISLSRVPPTPAMQKFTATQPYPSIDRVVQSFIYSTVTDLAKFLGKSTFKPSATASQ